MTYSLSDFDYHLPEELIAQEPARPRDRSRLLVYDRKTDEVKDDYFYNLTQYLPAGTTLVANNSKVEKCRLLFEGGAKEIFVVNTVNDRTVEALVRPGKKFRKGRTVEVVKGIEVEVTDLAGDGVRTLLLSRPLSDPAWDPYRVTPFPPYIKQNEQFSEEYQTVFAREQGSKAAPTAGLHFTKELIRELKQRGHNWEEVTLHVGLGTFAPVKEESIEKHIMHSEWYRINQKTADSLNSAEHVTAVGTTGVRVLESAANPEIEDGVRFRACSGETDIFIRPGYRFRSTNSLITNFHLPKSTLLMLVSAFAGYDEIRNLYEHAIREKYRFYSFGDAMLIV